MSQRILRLTLALALAAAMPAAAQWKIMKSDSQAIEVAAGSVTLPAGPTGSMHVIPCPRCTIVSLTVSAQSTFFIGNMPVSLGELRRHVSAQPDTLLVVTYATATKALRRVRAASGAQ